MKFQIGQLKEVQEYGLFTWSYGSAMSSTVTESKQLPKDDT